MPNDELVLSEFSMPDASAVWRAFSDRVIGGISHERYRSKDRQEALCAPTRRGAPREQRRMFDSSARNHYSDRLATSIWTAFIGLSQVAKVAQATAPATLLGCEICETSVN